MSVIVKGMEMPDGCENCLLRYRSQGAYCTDRCYATVVHKNIDPWTFGRTRNGDKPDWCPLRPLPEKHGRLIDEDALHALYESRWHDLQVLNWDENPHAEDIQTGVNWCINTLHDDLPTIVEAEGDDG